jgi:phospholipase C
MHRRLSALVSFVCALGLMFGVLASPAQARTTTHLSRVFYIMMENQGFDDVIGHENPTSYAVDTPFITSLAFKYGLETLSFGTTHPSLPNYLSLIGGSYYGIHDDNPSCYAEPAMSPCDTAKGPNLVDQLERAHLTWIDFQQSMPSVGFLGSQYPSSGYALYAQKHNPFLYYKDIVSNPLRMRNVVPLSSMATLAHTLSNPATAPNFVFIAPDQCHDMHGQSVCPSGDALLIAGDNYVRQLVTTIMRSPAYTPDSAIIINWDENDYSSNIGCCWSVFPNGGGHVATIVITPRYTTPLESALPMNHFNELRSIEDAFGLGYLNLANKVAPTLLRLLP